VQRRDLITRETRCWIRSVSLCCATFWESGMCKLLECMCDVYRESEANRVCVQHSIATWSGETWTRKEKEVLPFRANPRAGPKFRGAQLNRVHTGVQGRAFPARSQDSQDRYALSLAPACPPSCPSSHTHSCPSSCPSLLARLLTSVANNRRKKESYLMHQCRVNAMGWLILKVVVCRRDDQWASSWSR